MTTLVGIEITFHIAPEKRHEFLQTAESLLERSSESCAGLEGQAVFEEVGPPYRFMWSERWSSTRQVEERLRSPALGTLLGAIRVLGELDDLQIIEARSQQEP